MGTDGLARGADYCDIFRRQRKKRPLPLVSVPLTQRGAVYVDERQRARELMSFLLVVSLWAGERGIEGWPTIEQILARWPRLEGHVVPLPDSSGTPPPRTLGYWTDGAAHVAVVELSKSGRRLFIEYEGDVLHTNVSGYIFGDLQGET